MRDQRQSLKDTAKCGRYNDDNGDDYDDMYTWILLYGGRNSITRWIASADRSIQLKIDLKPNATIWVARHAEDTWEVICKIIDVLHEIPADMAVLLIVYIAEMLTTQHT